MGKPRLITIDTSLLRVPQYFCNHEGCNKSFNKLSRLKYHQNIHLEEKPYKCTFDGCRCSYYRPSHLKRHEESIHGAHSDCSNDYRCTHEGCEAAFTSESSLYYHSKRKHCAEYFRCSYCDKQFAKKWKIKEHEAGHTGAFPFKCDHEECSEEFKDHMSFRAHKRSHLKKKIQETVLPCPVDGCELSFGKWSELVNHKKAFHPLGNQCPTCKKTFTQRNLKAHLPIHQEIRDTFQCSYAGCPRFYFHPKNLTHHVKVKHEGKGFTCPDCDRTLSTKQKLIQHINLIHIRDPVPKRKRKLNVIKKVATMTDSDMTLKRPGPLRYIRQKYDDVIFPDNNGKTFSSQQLSIKSNNNVKQSQTSTATDNSVICSVTLEIPLNSIQDSIINSNIMSPPLDPVNSRKNDIDPLL